MAAFAVVVASITILSARQLCDASTTTPSPQSKLDPEGTASHLYAELAAGGKGDEARLNRYVSQLQSLHSSLPKGMGGLVSPQAVRYVLHRFFVAQHGWYVRGLEPGSAKQQPPPRSSAANHQQDWVSSYLLALLERREHEMGQRGTTLRELAALAAALEDVAAEEAAAEMESMLSLHRLPLDGRVPRAELESAMESFYVKFLRAGNFSMPSKEVAIRKQKLFAKRYANYQATMAFMHGLQDATLQPDKLDTVDVARAKDLAAQVGLSYHKLNENECSALKGTLRGMEGVVPGRVRLVNFYKHALYSHWKFTEKAEYLRVLGALDESNPDQPQVITANYIMSRPNCLNASSLYAICCRNECEDLMSSLEHEFGGPESEPARVADLVSVLSTDTVQAPRSLSAQLLRRLDEVAAANRGKVPLHGRLFAQWMHHAFPRECPYPHESAAHPHTPDEWMQKSGQAEASATVEEMRAHVEADTCAIGPEGEMGCGDAGAELPWTSAEELLAMPVQHGSAGVTAEDAVPQGAVLVPTLAFAAVLALVSLVAGRGQPLLQRLGYIVAAAILAFGLGIVSGAALACGFFCCSAMFALRLAAKHLAPSSRPHKEKLLADSCGV